ncbi:16S rRNA (guanine(527)-N(7))-methyltransferase RsmG [Sphingomonas sediminicola]|jgi:16S rRNA (guanine527-N7)-methyltransferase|uniref:16S rRNA (guanine(527)-N(7))-methyltransferase RsmG n=1 Tax=Sphingomonas sediminicola TaxID=386874 RepID=UPI003CEE8B32
MIERVLAASGRDVSRETFDRIALYVRILTQSAGGQNLIAPSTLGTIWERHVLDSAQLVRFEPFNGASWVDVGSGAGLPGLIVALLVKGPITLIEPRRLRAEFLSDVVSKLGLADRVTIECAKVERVQGKFDVITARAVAALDRLLAMTEHLSKSETVWVLPKGKNAQTELAQAQVNWHCDVRVEQSCTDPESQILVLTRVGAKK